MSQDTRDVSPSERGIAETDWRNRQRAARNVLALAYLGSGFVTIASGRAFLPLIGRPKRVPSPHGESWLAASWPKWWQMMVLVLICMMVAGGRFNGWSMSPLRAAVVSIGAPIVAVILWCWREQRLTRSWDTINDVHINRTSLVVDTLRNWSWFQLLSLLGGPIFFVLWHAYSLGTGPGLPAVPLTQGFSAADFGRWAGLLLLVAFYFVFARAAYWQAIALFRRMRKPAQSS